MSFRAVSKTACLWLPRDHCSAGAARYGRVKTSSAASRSVQMNCPQSWLNGEGTAITADLLGLGHKAV